MRMRVTLLRGYNASALSRRRRVYDRRRYLLGDGERKRYVAVRFDYLVKPIAYERLGQT